MQWYRLAVLREMGCNAVRTSHNMPTPEWVEACDRMGVMMMCETRQMSQATKGWRSWKRWSSAIAIRRAIIIWSIGNEEGQMQNEMAEQGAKVGASMVRLCHELDPTRVVSAAVNGNNKQGVSDALDILGFNYNLKNPEEYHKLFPKCARCTDRRP